MKISSGNHRIVGQFDVSHILIDGCSSCNIIYSKLFEKMSLNKVGLYTFKGFNLYAFNGTTTRPWGYVKLTIFVGDGKELLVVTSQFLVIPYKSVYNCILEIPFATS